MCEECNEKLTQKIYNRNIQSLRHKKNERLHNRNKIIEKDKDEGLKLTNKVIEQKLDEQYPEEGIKFCDSCDMYLDNNEAFNEYVKTLKHRNNVRLVNAEIVKNGSKFDCAICKTSLSQYRVDQHLKTKMHLDNDAGESTDKQGGLIDKDNPDGYCDVCNTRFKNKKEHSGSDEHKENVKQKKHVEKKWEEKVLELGLDHSMRHNQLIIPIVVIMRILNS